MPILTLQKRARELGRIRIGQKGPKGQPQKLDRFRITSPSQVLIEKVAKLYGGEARPWDNGGVSQWEVLTDSRRIPIMVPPQPVSQWLETWAGGSKGCVHRCDGETNMLTGEPCDLEDPDHLNAKPTTRLNVVLRDVEGIGVFRLESHGWNAAVELPDMAAFLSQAGGYVNGWLSLEERVSKSDGQTRRFIVPLIEIDVTPAQLMAGQGRVGAPSLEGPVQAPALEAGPSGPVRDFAAEIEAAADVDALHALWREVDAAGRLHEFRDVMIARAKVLKDQAPAAGQQPAAEETVDAELVDDPAAEQGDPDVVWQQVLAAAGELGMGLTEVVADFEQRYAMNPGSASAGELAAYLQVLRTEGRAA